MFEEGRAYNLTLTRGFVFHSSDSPRHRFSDVGGVGNLHQITRAKESGQRRNSVDASVLDAVVVAASAPGAVALASSTRSAAVPANQPSDSLPLSGKRRRRGGRGHSRRGGRGQPSALPAPILSLSHAPQHDILDGSTVDADIPPVPPGVVIQVSGAADAGSSQSVSESARIIDRRKPNHRDLGKYALAASVPLAMHSERGMTGDFVRIFAPFHLCCMPRTQMNCLSLILISSRRCFYNGRFFADND